MPESIATSVRPWYDEVSLSDVEIAECIKKIDGEDKLCYTATAIKGRIFTEIGHGEIRGICGKLQIKRYKTKPKEECLELIAEKKMNKILMMGYSERSKHEAAIKRLHESVTMDGESENDSMNKKARIINTGSHLRYQMNETKDHYNVEMDVPGIKHSDMKLDVVKGKKIRLIASRLFDQYTIKLYEQYVVFHKNDADLTNVTAHLEYGTLNLLVKKIKPEKPMKLLLDNNYNENEQETAKTLLSLDLPGVRFEDVNVVVHNSTIKVDATRIRGQSVWEVHKVEYVDLDKYNIKAVKGNYCDGVLTIKAPYNEMYYASLRHDRSVLIRPIHITKKDDNEQIQNKRTQHPANTTIPPLQQTTTVNDEVKPLNGSVKRGIKIFDNPCSFVED